MQPTQSTGPHLLLQKGTAAPPVKASSLTEYSGQFSSRKGLHQVHRPVQGLRVLWKDMPSLSGNEGERNTRNSLFLFIFHVFILLPYLLSLTYAHGQTLGVAAPSVWPGLP